jgi:hypothetical protein
LSSSEDSEGNTAPAGFSNFRTNNNASVIPSGFNIGATQDVFTPTPYLIYGLGQSSSSFVAQLPPGNTNSGVIQGTWSNKLVLAEGMYQTGSTPTIDFDSVDISVNVHANGPGGALLLAAATVSGGDVNEPPVVGDLGPLLGDQSANGPNVPTIVSGTLPAADDGGVANLSWMFDGASAGPAAPLNAPSLDPLTGLFSWDVNGQKGGLYTFPIKATDVGGLSDGGVLSVNVVVPEPATVCLIGLALVGFAGFRRK